MHPFFSRGTERHHAFVIGHRGSAGTCPENTLRSFSEALEAGAHILETDLHGSADGVPVLCHDPRVDRTTEGSGAIASLRVDEIRELDAGFSFRDAEGGLPFRGRGLRIPSLDEALREFPGIRFNIEIKHGRASLIERVISIVRDCGAEERVLLTAGEDQVMSTLRGELLKRACSVAQGACTGDVAAFLKAALGSGPAPAEPMALQIPASFQGVPLVTRELVEFAHQSGVEVHVWTINEAAEMSRLLDLGVDGIVTDFPQQLAKLIRERDESA